MEEFECDMAIERSKLEVEIDLLNVIEHSVAFRFITRFSFHISSSSVSAFLLIEGEKNSISDFL